MSPRARNIRDREQWLAHWNDRIILGDGWTASAGLTPAPRCPTCGELVQPAAWDRHQTEHLSDADTYNREMST